MAAVHRMSAAAVLAITIAGSGVSLAQIDHSEVGSLLIYPVVLTNEGVETFLRVTNAGPFTVGARVLFIHESSCSSCFHDFLLPSNGTETIAFTQVGGFNLMLGQSSGTEVTCPAGDGFAIVHEFDPATGLTTGDNVLVGSSDFGLYVQGWMASVPAIPFRSIGPAGPDTRFDFDGIEYPRLPQKLQGQFLAPGVGFGNEVFLGLFTPGFLDGVPPTTDCTITARDPTGASFSTSVIFGCASLLNLGDISSSFTYPDLVSLGSLHEHGWLELDCKVDGVASGGVHGTLMQFAVGGEVLRREAGGPALADPVNSADLFYQSGTGIPISYAVESCNGFDDNGNNIVDDGCDDDSDGYCDGGVPFAGQPQVCPNGGGDCDDQDSTVHAVPQPVTNVRWLSMIQFEWDSLAESAGTGTNYDVLRGLLDELPVGQGLNETCYSPNQSPTNAFDQDTPPLGNAFWYLVRGTNACGRGSYDFDSFGMERLSQSCP